MNLKPKLSRLCAGLGLFFLGVYKKTLSFVFWGSCRFSPTCSEYTYQAVARYGTIVGLWLGLRRVLRCHSWNISGYDPVPNLKFKIRNLKN